MSDLRVTVIRCSNCHEHQGSTKHIERRYLDEARKAREILSEILGLGADVEEGPSKMGALEVLLHREGFPPALIFSKLRVGRFPREGEIKNSLQKFLGVDQRQILPSFGLATLSSSLEMQNPIKTKAVCSKSRPATADTRSWSRSKTSVGRSGSLLDESAPKLPRTARPSTVPAAASDSRNSERAQEVSPVDVSELIDLAARRQWLRQLFVDAAKSYFGVPYLKPPPDAPVQAGKRAGFHLDCCGLVRQCVQDLRQHFGFSLRGWNQGYQFDTLPIALESHTQMQPGDLVFISAIYNNPEKKKNRIPAHNIVHVEIFIGGDNGEKTIGARQRYGVVEEHPSFRFVSKNYHSMVYHFRSIDTWLAGVCKSWCAEHRWRCG